jgi:hypothetical protein
MVSFISLWILSFHFWNSNIVLPRVLELFSTLTNSVNFRKKFLSSGTSVQSWRVNPIYIHGYFYMKITGGVTPFFSKF